MVGESGCVEVICCCVTNLSKTLWLKTTTTLLLLHKCAGQELRPDSAGDSPVLCGIQRGHIVVLIQLADEADWQIIRDHWPAYDKNITPTNTMGAVAEMFRLWKGSIRSDHPARSVCANGKYAEYITMNHDLSNIFGDGSPIGKLYELDAYVLLLGVGYDKNTSLHLADVRANYPGKHDCTEYSAILENGSRVWKKYDTLFVDGEDFDEIGLAFEKTGLVKNSCINQAEIRLMKQRELVDFAVKWIEENRI